MSRPPNNTPFAVSRLQAGLLTQRQAAQYLGVAPNTVARWECGQRSVPRWAVLAVERAGQKKSARRLQRAN